MLQKVILMLGMPATYPTILKKICQKLADVSRPEDRIFFLNYLKMFNVNLKHALTISPATNEQISQFYSKHLFYNKHKGKDNKKHSNIRMGVPYPNQVTKITKNGINTNTRSSLVLRSICN